MNCVACRSCRQPGQRRVLGGIQNTLLLQGPLDQAPIQHQINEPNLIRLVEPEGHRVLFDESQDSLVAEDPGVRRGLASATLAIPSGAPPTSFQPAGADPAVDHMMIAAKAQLQPPEGVSLAIMPGELHALEFQDGRGVRPAELLRHPMQGPPPGMIQEESLFGLRPLLSIHGIAEPELRGALLDHPARPAKILGDHVGPALDPAIISTAEDLVALRRPHIFHRPPAAMFPAAVRTIPRRRRPPACPGAVDAPLPDFGMVAHQPLSSHVCTTWWAARWAGVPASRAFGLAAFLNFRVSLAGPTAGAQREQRPAFVVLSSFTQAHPPSQAFASLQPHLVHV